MMQSPGIDGGILTWVPTVSGTERIDSKIRYAVDGIIIWLDMFHSTLSDKFGDDVASFERKFLDQAAHEFMRHPNVLRDLELEVGDTFV